MNIIPDVIQLSLSSSNYFTSEEARYVTIRVTTSQPTLSDTVVNLRDQAGQAISKILCTVYIYILQL